MNKKTAIVSVQMNMMGLMCGMAMCGMIFCVEKIADQNQEGKPQFLRGCGFFI